MKRLASKMALSIDIRERYVDLAIGGPLTANQELIPAAVYFLIVA